MTFICKKALQRALRPTSYVLLPVFLLSGCFNEPEPAYKSVPAEARVYLSEKSLKGKLDFTNAAVAASFKAENLAKIDYLNLDRNQLTDVSEVAKLVNLKWLRLNENQLTSLPDLKALRNLRRIYLKNNRLTKVPETLKDLPALTDIELSGNPITEVPDWLAAKPGLKGISLTRTRIKALPKNLEDWQSLQQLQLGDLQLSPEEMARIRKALPKTAILF